MWHLGLVYVAFGFSYIIYMTFFTKHLIAEGGYTKDAAGDLFMIMGWVSLVCGLLWGTVSDVIGRRRALIIVFLIHAAAFSLFALWRDARRLHAVGGPVRPFGLEHPGDHGGGLRRCPWPETGSGSTGADHASIRHRAGGGAQRRRCHGRRQRLVLISPVACGGCGACGRPGGLLPPSDVVGVGCHIR